MYWNIWSVLTCCVCGTVLSLYIVIRPSSVLEHVVSVDMSMYVDSRIVLYIVIGPSSVLEHVVSVDMSMYVGQSCCYI